MSTPGQVSEPSPAPAAERVWLAPSLEEACERWPDRPAITYRGATLTYGALWEQVVTLARAYAHLGVGPGERIVCQLPTRPEHLVSSAAAWAAGAVHVGADKDLTPTELAVLTSRTDAAAVVVQPPPDAPDPTAYAAAVGAARPGTLTIVHEAPGSGGEPTLGELLEPSGRAPTPLPPGGADAASREDTALLFLTSGTTGIPKVVMDTLPGLWAKMRFFADAFGPGPGDVHLMFLTLSHAFGLKLSLTALCSGGRLVMLDRFSPEEALRLAGDEHASVLAGSPAHLAMLLDCFDSGRHDLAGLRWVVSAAAPLPRRLLERIYDTLGVEVFYVYGCSEGFLTATTDRSDLLRGSVGKVGRNVFEGPEGTAPDGTVTVIDPEHQGELPPETVGEIAYGARCPVRYWQGEPAATDGRYRTGDLGWIDGEGRLFVSGRIKDVVNRGGLKVMPAEVEAVLLEHADVADCAVVPTPDPVLGDAICACVVPSGERVPTLHELRSFLATTLARHKLPDELCVLHALPRSRPGKLDRTALVRSVVDGAAPRERLRPR